MIFKTNKTGSRTIGLILIALIAFAATAVFPQTQGSADGEPANVLASFSNTNPLNIPDNAGASSVINVSGMTGEISRLTVTLNGVFHLRPSDLDFLLVAPDGSQMVVLSDAGGTFALNDSIIRLSDFNAAAAPATSTIGNGLVDYKPTNYGSFDTFTGVSGFPQGAAPGGSATLSSVFSVINPNGQWRLFVEDDTSGGNGANSRLIRGWALNIETADNLTVNSFADTNDGFCDSHCTLREAVTIASNGSTIRFAAGLNGATIVLSAPLDIEKSIKITAIDFNTSRVTVSGNGVGTVISISNGADVTLENLVIAGGASRFFGAGISNRGSLFLQNCIVRGNILRDPAGNSLTGAGIFSTGNLRLFMTTVEQNEIRESGSGLGAGICMFSQNGQPLTLTMNFSVVRDNRITRNFADTENSGAGIALSGNVSALIVDSAITGNGSQNDGAAIFNDGGNVKIINSTIAENTASARAAYAAANAGRAEVVNSTFTDNFAFTGCALTGLPGTVTIRNTILYDNGFCDMENVTSLGSNLIRVARNSTIDPSDLTGNRNSGLGTFGNNGGIVPTIPLLSNSPAINAGNSCVLLPPDAGGCSPVQLFTDARLLARNLGGSVDIGAAEFNLLPSGTLEPNGRRSLPAAVLGQPYNQEIFAVVGGNSTVAVTGFDIPGLSFTEPVSAASQIMISGVPTAAGAYNFTVAVTDVAGYSVVGNYTLHVLVPTAASVTVAGRVFTGSDRTGRARVTLTGSDGRIRTVSANTFGYFQFDDVAVGETYVLNAQRKGFSFAPQVIFVDATRSDLEIVGTGERVMRPKD